jgi:hypothetical protein
MDIFTKEDDNPKLSERALKYARDCFYSFGYEKQEGLELSAINLYKITYIFDTTDVVVDLAMNQKKQRIVIKNGKNDAGIQGYFTHRREPTTGKMLPVVMITKYEVLEPGTIPVEDETKAAWLLFEMLNCLIVDPETSGELSMDITENK